MDLCPCASPSPTSPAGSCHHYQHYLRKGERKTSKGILQNSVKKKSCWSEQESSSFIFPFLLLLHAVPGLRVLSLALPGDLGRESQLEHILNHSLPPAQSHSEPSPAPDRLTFICHRANFGRGSSGGEFELSLPTCDL